MGADVAAFIFVHQRRARFDCGFDAGHRRQLLVVDVNQRQRFLGNCNVHRRHRRHRLADVAHLIDGDHRPAVIDRVQIGDIRRRQHRDDTGQRLGLRGVNRAEPRMGKSASQDFSIKHSRNGDITDKFRRACDFLDTVDALDTVPDELELALSHELSRIEK